VLTGQHEPVEGKCARVVSVFDDVHLRLLRANRQREHVRVIAPKAPRGPKALAIREFDVFDDIHCSAPEGSRFRVI
jgi:hypothetical protein